MMRGQALFVYCLYFVVAFGDILSYFVMFCLYFIALPHCSHLLHKVQEMGKQAAKKLSNAFEEARSSPFWQKAQGYWEEKRTLGKLGESVTAANSIQFTSIIFNLIHVFSASLEEPNFLLLSTHASKE